MPEVDLKSSVMEVSKNIWVASGEEIMLFKDIAKLEEG